MMRKTGFRRRLLFANTPAHRRRSCTTATGFHPATLDGSAVPSLNFSGFDRPQTALTRDVIFAMGRDWKVINALAGDTAVHAARRRQGGAEWTTLTTDGGQRATSGSQRATTVVEEPARTAHSTHNIHMGGCDLLGPQAECSSAAVPAVKPAALRMPEAWCGPIYRGWDTRANLRDRVTVIQAAIAMQPGSGATIESGEARHQVTAGKQHTPTAHNKQAVA